LTPDTDTKPILTQLQNIITKVQMDSYCQSVRGCPSCRLPRTVKDYRERRLDSVLGTIVVRAPRFQCCQACEGSGTYSPVSQLLPDRVLPELCPFASRICSGTVIRSSCGAIAKSLADNRWIVRCDHPQPYGRDRQQDRAGISQRSGLSKANCRTSQKPHRRHRRRFR